MVVRVITRKQTLVSNDGFNKCFLHETRIYCQSYKGNALLKIVLLAFRFICQCSRFEIILILARHPTHLENRYIFLAGEALLVVSVAGLEAPQFRECHLTSPNSLPPLACSPLLREAANNRQHRVGVHTGAASRPL